MVERLAPDTEGGLYLKTADLARIGYLILENGAWQGQQVVPAQWIERATGTQVTRVRPDDTSWSYGYLWWLMEGGPMGLPKVIMALGYGGQHLFIVPDLDLVVVFNAWNLYGPQPDLVSILTTQILPAVRPRP